MRDGWGLMYVLPIYGVCDGSEGRYLEETIVANITPAIHTPPRHPPPPLRRLPNLGAHRETAPPTHIALPPNTLLPLLTRPKHNIHKPPRRTPRRHHKRRSPPRQPPRPPIPILPLPRHPLHTSLPPPHPPPLRLRRYPPPWLDTPSLVAEMYP